MANNSTEEIEPLKSNVNKFTIVDNDEIPGCKRKVKKIINSHKFHTIIVILVVIDCLAVASELGINEIKGRLAPKEIADCKSLKAVNPVERLQTNHTVHARHVHIEPQINETTKNHDHDHDHDQPHIKHEPHGEGFIHILLEVLENIMKYTSLCILGVFVIEITTRLIVDPIALFSSVWEVMDSIIVIVSFSMNVYLLFHENAFGHASDLLMLLRLWRIGEIINGIIVSLKLEQERKVKKLEKKIEYLEEQVRDLMKQQKTVEDTA